MTRKTKLVPQTWQRLFAGPCRVTFSSKSGLTGHSKSRQHAEPPAQSSPLVMDVESEQIAEVPEVFFVLPQPKEAPKKDHQVKKKCRDKRKGSNKRHQWEFVFQDPCSIDLSVLQSHQAPSPILLIDLSVLLFHQAPSPSLSG